MQTIILNGKNSNFVNDILKLKAIELVQKHGKEKALQLIEDEIKSHEIENEVLENIKQIKGRNYLHEIQTNILNFENL